MTRATILALFLCVAGLMPAAHAAEGNVPVMAGTGTIEALDFGGATLVVRGLRYHVPPEVEVEIAGSYGAFTMLETGMRIHYEYLAVSPTERRMLLIRELPPGVTLEET